MTSGESIHTLELPYRRSVGPVVGAFLTGLRDQQVLGSRTSGGRVIVPPLEYDPETGDAVDELVEVGSAGVVTTWAWVDEPLRKHPLDRPFAWVLVQLDGADTSLVHALDADSADAVSTGMRVQIRWAEAREGHIHDIACFEAERIARPWPERPGAAGAKSGKHGNATRDKVDPSADVLRTGRPLMAEAPQEEGGPVRFMKQHIALDYKVRVSPLAARFGEQLRGGQIVGTRCPRCGLVYVPTRAFCPMCTVAMGERDEAPLPDRGTVTSFTILTPIQYHGQKEREDYALASILIDGADGTVGQQRLSDIPLDEVRTGLRVEAVWAPEDERTGDPGDRGYGFGDALRGWRPTGEPDVPADEYAEHVL